VDIEYASKELKGNYSFNSYLFLNTSAPLADLSKNKRERVIIYLSLDDKKYIIINPIYVLNGKLTPINDM